MARQKQQKNEKVKASVKETAEQEQVLTAMEEQEVVKATEQVDEPTPKVEAVKPVNRDLDDEIERAPINMVVEKKAPPVKILYVDSAIPNNQIPIGQGRYITGSGRIFAVPLEQFEGEFMSPLVMKLLDNRKFVVLDGLSDEQRMQYNCYYSEGEVVKNEGVFDALITMPIEKAAEIFEALCPQHRQLAATRFMTAYFEKHDNRITRDRIERLNKISRENEGSGLFVPILEDMNKEFV